MKRTLLTLALAWAGTALAQGTMTDGEVRKIDAAGGRITLQHGEIKNLDMPPMTMVFRVKDAAMLGKVQVGDRVRFTAEKIGGNYTVTAISKAP
jgi:Cu(I)/Ag(I) efflux system periplasmic protein CusF